MASFDDVAITEEDLINGSSMAQIFETTSRNNQGITFDDLITLPGSIDFGVGDVELNSLVSRHYSLKTPLCSTPMDTVTEHEMAIGMALNGGVGFIHCKCTIEQQVAMVRKVKAYENGFILEPSVLSPENTLADLNEIKKNKKIKGVPVTEDGKLGSRLVGIVSNRDTDFVENTSTKIKEVMTPLENLITATFPISIEDAYRALKESKKGYLPIVDNYGCLVALTTRTDMKKKRDFPLSSKDSTGRLLVGAAVPAHCRCGVDRERIDALVQAGVNIIVLDAINGDNTVQLETLAYIKNNFTDRMVGAMSPKKSSESKIPIHLDVIAGNVVRVSQAKQLLDAGADGLRIGMGVGSVATTQLLKAVGRAQLSAIYYCALEARKYGVPVIADGGLKNTGCLIKALTVGASCVMMGSLLAGVDESPGEFFFQDGKRLKNYRAITARDQSQTHGDAGFSSGVSGAVVDKGPLNAYLPYLCQSIRHGFQDMGTRSITDTHEQVYSGVLRFELRSASAQKEGGVHDLFNFTQRLFA